MKLKKHAIRDLIISVVLTIITYFLSIKIFNISFGLIEGKVVYAMALLVTYLFIIRSITENLEKTHKKRNFFEIAFNIMTLICLESFVVGLFSINNYGILLFSISFIMMILLIVLANKYNN